MTQATDTNTDIETLIELSKSRVDFIRECIAKNPKTPKEILEVLSEDKSPFVRAGVAEITDSLVIIEKLSKDKARVRCALSDNPNTPKEILKELCSDSTIPNQIVIDYIAQGNNIYCLNILSDIMMNCPSGLKYLVMNEMLPHENLIRFASHKNKFIRKWVAENINTPIEVLKKLSKDEEYIVRSEVCNHINTSDEILKDLLNDSECKEKVLKRLVLKKGLSLLE